MDLFLLKKIISELIMPINIILFLLILAIVFYKKRPSLSFKFLLSGVLLLFVSTFQPITNNMMVMLEDNFEAFSRSSTPVDYIVVLGCSHQTNAALPVTSQLKICSLQRLVEAVRIYNLHPEATLITSGFSADNSVSNAEVMKQSAILLGVPNKKIMTENFPHDTEEEAQLIAPRVRGKNVVLVTNANHMPRAIKYFQMQGINPIAAPTGFWIKNSSGEKNWSYYFPKGEKLAQTTSIWYETLGRTVQWLKGIFN